MHSLKENPVQIRNSHHYCNVDEKAIYHWANAWEGAFKVEAKSGELPYLENKSYFRVEEVYFFCCPKTGKLEDLRGKIDEKGLTGAGICGTFGGCFL